MSYEKQKRPLLTKEVCSGCGKRLHEHEIISGCTSCILFVFRNSKRIDAGKFQDTYLFERDTMQILFYKIFANNTYLCNGEHYKPAEFGAAIVHFIGQTPEQRKIASSIKMLTPLELYQIRNKQNKDSKQLDLPFN